jgi:hypothetical protein
LLTQYYVRVMNLCLFSMILEVWLLQGLSQVISNRREVR